MSPSGKTVKEDSVNQQMVSRVQASLPADNEIFRLVDTFKILGDPTRLRIMLALTREELCVCDLSSIANLSVSAISHQLRLLRNMRLVKYRKSGKMVYYSLDDDHIETIIQQTQVHVRE